MSIWAVNLHSVNLKFKNSIDRLSNRLQVPEVWINELKDKLEQNIYTRSQRQINDKFLSEHKRHKWHIKKV